MLTGEHFYVLQSESTGLWWLIPCNAMGRSLEAHCKSNGVDLSYQTEKAAEEASRSMKTAIKNRNGRPWKTFSEGVQ